MNSEILLAFLSDSSVGQHPIWQMEGSFKELDRMEDFYRQKEVWQGSSSNKEWIVLGKVTFLWGKAGWGGGPTKQMTSLVPTR